MSPAEWAIRPLRKYASFSGRAPRAEIWWFFLALCVVGFGLLAMIGGMAAAAQTTRSAGLLGAVGVGAIFLVLFWLVALIPTIAVQVRRLHDTSRSAWWLGGYYLLYVIYFVLMLRIGMMGSAMGAGTDGATDTRSLVALFSTAMVLGLGLFVYFIVLLVFYCLPGTRGPNKYGEDPYGSNVEQVFA